MFQICGVCAAPALIHLYDAHEPIARAEKHFCRGHLHQFLDARRIASESLSRVSHTLDSACSCEIDYLIVDEESRQSAVNLRECCGARALAIGTGMCEVSAIGRSLSAYAEPRPLTHRAMTSAIEALEGKIKDVLIYDLRDAVYFANLRIHHAGQVLCVDIRATDGIAVALNAHAPILVAEGVLRRANNAE